MDPYTAATRFVIEKSATEKAVQHINKAIGRDLLKYQNTFREQAESPKPAY